MIAVTTIWLFLSIGPANGTQRIVSIEKFATNESCIDAKTRMEKIIKRDTGTLKDLALTCMPLQGVVK